MVNAGGARRENVQLPLLDLLDGSEMANQIITPLPSEHLPAELTTPFVYGMQLHRPLHKLILQEATESDRLYGHIVWKDKDSDSLVGAIGCAADVLVNAPTTEIAVMSSDGSSDGSTVVKAGPDVSNQALSNDKEDDTTPITVLCRGSFRFVVKEVIKTIPYPVVVVDELLDDGGDEEQKDPSLDGMDDDEDDDYSDLSTSELMQRTMRAIQNLVTQKLERIESQKDPSPLEQSILEDSGILPLVNPVDAERNQVEEIAAVWEIFQSSLVDDIEPSNRKFAVAFMGAELADMPNEVRRQLLVERNPTRRLRRVLKELEETVGMARAKKLATQITDDVDESSKDLKVGQPQLPPWSRQIKKGTRIEYFWSEQDGWLGGEVEDDPVLVVDELIVTVRFDDGEIHRLPFVADEKVRWRPG